MTTWWIRDPDRLERELAALQIHGELQAEPVRDELAGTVNVELSWREPRKMRLIVRYPREFPWFPPLVDAPDEDFSRHQHPDGGNLCLLANPTQDWDPTETAADLIVGQLPRLLKAVEEPMSPRTADIEERQGEPWSEYFPYGDHCLLVPKLEACGSFGEGRLKWGWYNGDERKAVLLELRSDDGQILSRAPEWLVGVTKGRFVGTWRRGQPPDPSIGPRKLFDSVIGNGAKARKKRKPKQPTMALAVFSEESAWRSDSIGCVPILELPTKQGLGHCYVRPQPIEDEVLFARIAPLEATRSKKVVIVGLGMLGAPLCHQLARIGFDRLTLVDFDHVEASTAVRWFGGLAFAGERKPQALKRLFASLFPYTGVSALCLRLGDPSTPTATLNEFGAALEGADLIIDATAEECVTNYLNSRASELKLPFIWVYAGQGGNGGAIGRYSRSSSGCWFCSRCWQFERPEWVPAATEDDGIQPRGCRALTAVGTGLDTDQIAVAAAQLAASTLCDAADDGYASADWDFAVLDTRDSDGGLLAAQWRMYSLERHKDCALHE